MLSILVGYAIWENSCVLSHWGFGRESAPLLWPCGSHEDVPVVSPASRWLTSCPASYALDPSPHSLPAAGWAQQQYQGRSVPRRHGTPWTVDLSSTTPHWLCWNFPGTAQHCTAFFHPTFLLSLSPPRWLDLQHCLTALPDTSNFLPISSSEVFPW